MSFFVDLFMRANSMRQARQAQLDCFGYCECFVSNESLCLCFSLYHIGEFCLRVLRIGISNKLKTLAKLIKHCSGKTDTCNI